MPKLLDEGIFKSKNQVNQLWVIKIFLFAERFIINLNLNIVELLESQSGLLKSTPPELREICFKALQLALQSGKHDLTIYIFCYAHEINIF